MMTYKISYVLAIALILFVAMPSMSQGPPCSPQPYPVQFDLSDLDDPGTIDFALKMQDFLEHRVVEEVYLRFCSWGDTLIGGCNIWVDSIFPCNNIITIDTDSIVFVNTATKDKYGDEIINDGGPVTLVFHDKKSNGSKTMTWIFPDSLYKSYVIRYHPNCPYVGHWIMDFYTDDDSGFTWQQHWRPHDQEYTQMGQYLVEDATATMDTIFLNQKYYTELYSVILTWASPCPGVARKLIARSWYSTGCLSDSSFRFEWDNCPGAGDSTQRINWYTVFWHKNEFSY